MASEPRLQRRPRRISAEERGRFLEALQAGWSVSRAARLTGVERTRFYDLRSRDEEFERQWDEAIETGTQLLEDELRRRSIEGFDEVTTDGEGNVVRSVRRMHGSDLHYAIGLRRPELRRIDGRLDVSIDSPAITEAIEAFTSRIAQMAAAATMPALEPPVDAEVVEAE